MASTTHHTTPSQKVHGTAAKVGDAVTGATPPHLRSSAAKSDECHPGSRGIESARTELGTWPAVAVRPYAIGSTALHGAQDRQPHRCEDGPARHAARPQARRGTADD